MIFSTGLKDEKLKKGNILLVQEKPISKASLCCTQRLPILQCLCQFIKWSAKSTLITILLTKKRAIDLQFPRFALYSPKAEKRKEGG